jgi:hypothetical protein
MRRGRKVGVSAEPGAEILLANYREQAHEYRRIDLRRATMIGFAAK